jgi:hypothetical protein
MSVKFWKFLKIMIHILWSNDAVEIGKRRMNVLGLLKTLEIRAVSSSETSVNT